MKQVKLLCVVLVGILFSACASAPKVEKAYCSDGRELPAWTVKGGMAFPGDIGKVFYGAGMSSNIANPALLRESADNRAINELAKQFEVYTASLMNDYMASTSAADKQSEEQHVETVKKTVVKQTLNGVMIVDRCQERVSGMYYSLARMDMDKFKEAIAKKAELSDKMKEYVRANANRMLEKLEREEEKH